MEGIWFVIKGLALLGLASAIFTWTMQFLRKLLNQKQINKLSGEDKHLFEIIAQIEGVRDYQSLFSSLKVKEIIMFMPYVRLRDRKSLIEHSKGNVKFENPELLYADAKDYAKKVEDHRRIFKSKDENGSAQFYKLTQASLDYFNHINKLVQEKRNSLSGAEVPDEAIFEKVLADGQHLVLDAAGAKRFIDDVEVCDRNFFWGKIKVSVELIPDLKYQDRIKRIFIEVGYPFSSVIFASPDVNEKRLKWVLITNRSRETKAAELHNLFLRGGFPFDEVVES